MPPSNIDDGPPARLRARWIEWRNRMLASERFQQLAARFWLTRPIARRRAAHQFDLVSGFVQSQILYACVESGLIDLLSEAVRSEAELGKRLDLAQEPLQRLLKGAAALQLVEPLDQRWWALGTNGAELSRNEGAKAMIRHHHLLYRDMADPLKLLRDARATPGHLANFWRYDDQQESDVAPYSALMAASQPMVHAEVLASYDFSMHRRMLDIGAGAGAFIAAVADNCRALHFGHADLPAVSALAEASLQRAGHADRVAFHPLDFHREALPDNYDLMTLVRILHDHDDAEVAALLTKIYRALPAGGKLLIAEPMAGTKGAEAMGDAYFGFYLWAMGRGRPRRVEEYGNMLVQAGFKRWRELPTDQPLIARVIMAEH